MKAASILLALVVGPVALFTIGCDYAENARKNQQRMNQLNRENFDEQIADVKKANGGRIGLYDAEEIDALLQTVRGMPEIHEVGMDSMPKLSEDGMASLATLPNLRELDISSSPVTDKGLAHFRGHPSLEKLVLDYTHVSNDVLRHLREIPNLKSLTLNDEPGTGTHLTDAGLVHLESISTLRELRIIGGWASKVGIARLQSKLPNCKIFETADVPRR